MKKFKLILRIIVSPIVFFVTFGALTIFIGPLALLLGVPTIIMKLLGVHQEESYEDLLIFSSVWLWVPFINTFSFIKKAKFIC